MKVGFMTPMINTTSQFNNRIDNTEISKNRAALLAMGGIKPSLQNQVNKK